MKKLTEHYFAVDLGATSGRTIIGTLSQDRITLRELTRFNNPIIEVSGHCYWDIYALYNEIIKGLCVAKSQNIDICSIGIDTWGVDVVCVAQDGALLRNPISYRDPYTTDVMEKYFSEKVNKEQVYRTTGIQFMPFNTLFQLYAMRKGGDSALEHARKVLFIPDALTYLLTDKAICERTIASTSQILDPNTNRFDPTLLSSIGLTENNFGEIIEPGTVVGNITSRIKDLTELGDIPVIAVAGHDTASAVAAVPASEKNFAYLSSGTWSLMGIETKQAIINDLSYQRNFTNEGGIEGTTRFLKNICGMWIYERCRKEWQDAPTSHAELQAEAVKQPPFQYLINPDDNIFANPSNMIEAIKTYCRNTKQGEPQGYAQICRCIFDSLALRYRQVFSYLEEFSTTPLNALHIIGGGSMNNYLNQFTANSTGIKVLAGPQEATAIGNIMMQAKAVGSVEDIHQMREIIANSVEMRTFLPKDTQEWDRAYDKYIAVTNTQ